MHKLDLPKIKQNKKKQTNLRANISCGLVSAEPVVGKKFNSSNDTCKKMLFVSNVSFKSGIFDTIHNIAYVNRNDLERSHSPSTILIN